MPKEPSARLESAFRWDAPSTELRNDLWAILDEFGSNGNPLDTWLGPLAGLLVAKWAAYEESKWQELPATNRQGFAPELPESLGLAAWDRAKTNHANALVEALRRMRVGTGLLRLYSSLSLPVVKVAVGARAEWNWGSFAARYVAQVAPLVTRAAEGSPPMIEELVAWMHRADLGNQQGRALAAYLFDEVLRTAVDKHSNLMGRYVTPGPVAALMLELVDPKPGERVYDPCFGFGELLVKATRRLYGAEGANSQEDRSQVPGSGIFGFEINPISYGVGLCRVLLGCVDQPVLELADTLGRPLPSDRSREGFDCILAAPPWSHRPASHSLLPVHFPVPSRNTEILFLQHVMSNLRPGGRAVVVYPYEALADPDTQEHYPAGNQVRKTLLSEFRIDAVVSLPPDAFAPVTDIDPRQARIMVFRRSTPRLRVPSVDISDEAWGAKPDVRDGDDSGRDIRSFENGSITASGVSPKLLREVSDWVGQRSTQSAVERPTGVEVSERPVRDLLLDDPLRPVMMYYPVRPDDLVREGRTPRIEPLERVADIYDAGLGRHSLAEDQRSDGAVADSLRVGDIVVTTTGDVGKIHLVSAGNMVELKPAKNKALVRPREGIKPEYLAAILRSPLHRNWMESHARRRTIQRLSLRDLREIRIPVPDVTVQEFVLLEIEFAPNYKTTAVLNKLLDSCGHDAVAVLFRVLSGSVKYRPLAVWTENPIVAALVAERDDQISDPWNALIGCARLLSELSQSLKEERYYDSDSRIWSGLDKAIEAAVGLVLCKRVPLGAARLVVLERARGKLYLAMEELYNAVFSGDRSREAEDATPYSTRLWWFLFVMVSFADREIQAMRESIRLDIAVEPNNVAFGVDSEIQLRVTNRSYVPLQDLQINTRPAVGKGNIDFLADGASTDIPLTVHLEGSDHSFEINVSWRARDLDGFDVYGETAIFLSVNSPCIATPTGDMGASPYNVGNPVERPEMFFGRTGLMDRIRWQLGSQANVILLEGNRRTGKTSILKQLQKSDNLSDWIPVYCSFQEAEGDDKLGGVTTRNIFRLLARTTGLALYDAGVETWFPDFPDRAPGRPFKWAFRSVLNHVFANDHPFETFALYLEAALQAARPKRVLLMLDEFEKLQEGIDARITSPQVPENIRHLLQHQPRLSAIITGSLGLKRLREQHWSALFGIGHPIPVNALLMDDARQLVTRPVEGRIDYLPQARDQVVGLCARQPFLIQSLCNRVFEQAAPGNSRTITPEIVERAATEMVEDNEHFRTLWDYAGSIRRRILLWICNHLAEGPDPVNLDLLSAELHKRRIPFRRVRDLADDISALRELELLDLHEHDLGRGYGLAVPLMSKWLNKNVDYDDLLVRARQEPMEDRP